MKSMYLSLLSILFFSCGSVWDKKVSPETVSEVMPLIQGQDSLKEGKKKFLAEMIPMASGLASFATDENKGNLPTYRELYNMYSRQFDSLEVVYNTHMTNNKKLKELIELVDVTSFAFSEHSAMLAMTVKLNNTFGKDILYIVLRYKMVDKYDTEYFNQTAKLTDKLIKGNSASFSVNHKYDEVSDYMWKKAPSKDERRKEVFKENFTIEPIGVVFTDKSEVTFVEADWKYL